MLIWGQKGANLDQKGPKMGVSRFFLELSLGYLIKRPKMYFRYAKLGRFYDLFLKLVETSIFGLKMLFLDINWPKNGPNKIFQAKPENVTSLALGSFNFVPSFRKFL